MTWIQANWGIISTILSAVLFLVAKIPNVEHNTIAEVAIWMVKQLLPAYTGPGSTDNPDTPPAQSSSDLSSPHK